MGCAVDASTMPSGALDTPGRGVVSFGRIVGRDTMKAKTNTCKFRWNMFVGGLIAVLLGYVLLAVGNVTFSPLLLVAGYCVLIPLAFL